MYLCFCMFTCSAESPKPVVTSVEPRLQPDSSNKATSADKPVSDMAQEKKDEEAEHVPPSEGEESVSCHIYTN